MRLRLPSTRLSTITSIAFAMPVIAMIGWLDYATGPIAMSLLYFVPIVIAAWLSSWVAAIVVPLGAGVAWIVAEFAVSPHGAEIVVWNAFTRTSTFVILAVMVRVVRQDRDRLSALNVRLEDALQLEARVARTDPLTELPNARSFGEALDRELARCHREGLPIGLAYLDLDNFKRINDALGHEHGDEVLRRAAQVLRRSVRAEDLPARLGGDEFAIVCVMPSEEGLRLIAERVMVEFEVLALDYERFELGCTIGMVLFAPAPADAITAVREADELMYEVKRRAKGNFEVRVIGGSAA